VRLDKKPGMCIIIIIKTVLSFFGDLRSAFHSITNPREAIVFSNSPPLAVILAAANPALNFIGIYSGGSTNIAPHIATGEFAAPATFIG